MPEKENHAVIEGSSPPAVFVSSRNYPRVILGPMVPSMHGDTSFLDEPEMWYGKSFNEILGYRNSLVRGLIQLKNRHASEPDSTLVRLHELLMSSRSVDSMLKLSKPPIRRLFFNEFTPPLGPYGKMEDFTISIARGDRKIEKVYYDTDMKAEEAILYLYMNGFSVNMIQKILSLGMVGIRNQRKIVPTRWSITAVDGTVSKKLVEQIKEYKSIDTYRVYKLDIYGNRYVAILIPSKWSFEWIEAWFPGTAWSSGSTEPSIIGDSEGYFGRSDYATVGGCYYSVRLAVSERLARERRQAGALILREVYPGFFAKIGVWNVRESVRMMMKQGYSTHGTFREAISEAMSYLKIPIDRWYSVSKIIKKEVVQTKLTGGLD